ncbi:hypothetical protein LPW11_07510 [Geomonas sp. RF6]|uniref:hypothetical protein n=1 Tax=Geomonas sp. RF6 TaxID=2897342 RepID=UPI001E5A11C4|nr:hypothetical protein [Geomonas sp. RF6]UFS72030.1 hypothetical protein LPW11_07510 [Geomonas sp. RF6]
MAENVEIFSYFVSLVFSKLYEQFPIEVKLERDEVLTKFYQVINAENLFDIMEDVNYCEYLNANAATVSSEQKHICEKLSKQCEIALAGNGCDKQKYETIFDYTIDFLVTEGLMRKIGVNSYQMTHRGFSQIHRHSDGETMIIEYFKRNVSDPEAFLGSLSSEVMVRAISRFLGVG